MEVFKASLDRFEDNYAVVYYSDDDNNNNRRKRRFDLPREMVHDAKPGARLLLHVDGNYVARVEIDQQGTEDARERIRKKYERLRSGNNNHLD
jgi:hypothetical protein